MAAGAFGVEMILRDMVGSSEGVVEAGEGVLHAATGLEIQDQWRLEHGAQGCIVVFLGEDHQHRIVSDCPQACPAGRARLLSSSSRVIS